MSVERVESIEEGLVDFCSAAIGGKVISFSDQYFADAANLINPKDPIRKAGYYVPTGAWFDGWETRRHNKNPSDWVIIKLGVVGEINSCEIDTAYFNGNEAPAVSIEGTEKYSDNCTWEEIMPKTPCGPSQRHFFKFPATKKQYTHVRLHQYPDGGIARFRLYGHVIPIFPDDPNHVIDTASVEYGGVAIQCSNQHFGRKENLLLPGRGVDMGDGWETARSREPGHCDWVVVKLGARTVPERIVVDTAHFRGNFPQAIEVQGTDHYSGDAKQQHWNSLVSRTETSADTEHVYNITQRTPVTHVKLTIYPDGGVKRIRVFGKRV